MDQPTNPSTPPSEDAEPAARRPGPRRRMTPVAGIAALVAAAVITAAVVVATHSGGGVASQVGRLGASFRIAQASALATPASTSAIESRVDPGLVDINVSNSSTGSRGSATGMVLTPSGAVLTNNHVVQGATSIKATDIGNGRTYTATVVGYDRGHDVAVIQLRGASGLKTVPLGHSAGVGVGARVTALGNAGGGGGTPSVATGSVVQLGQSIIASDIGGGNAERLAGLIQTNAAVLPGDSGGPLVNDGGQVIGMDAAASATNAAYVSRPAQSFAIPIDSAIAIAKQIETGPAGPGVHVGPTAFLGVAVIPTSLYGGLGGATSQAHGALVGAALPGYPAAQAGLSKGDVITSVDGQTVTSATELTSLLSAHHPGDSVRIGWTDPSGQTHSATVKLGSGPAA